MVTDFNIDIFFKIFAKENYKTFVKQIPQLAHSDVLFYYAIAKGYGFNKIRLDECKNFLKKFNFDPEGTQFLVEATQKEWFRNINRKISYIPILQTHDHYSDWQMKSEFGILYSKLSNYSFLIHSSYDTNYFSNNFPQVIKKFKNQKNIQIKNFKKEIFKFLLKENTYYNKVKLNEDCNWNIKELIALFKKLSNHKKKLYMRDIKYEDRAPYQYYCTFLIFRNRTMMNDIEEPHYSRATINITPEGKVINYRKL